MEINYKKNKNSELFNKIISENLLDLEKIQNYIPIYNVFFNLNDTNYNSINLNNMAKIFIFSLYSNIFLHSIKLLYCFNLLFFHVYRIS